MEKEVKQKKELSNDEIIEKIKNEYRITHMNFNLTKEQLKDVEFLIKVLKTNRMYFSKKVLTKIKIEDKKLLDECLKLSPYSICYACDDFKDNKEIVIPLLSENGDLLEFLSNRLKDDKDVVLVAVGNNGNSLKFASERLRDDKEVVITALGISDNIKIAHTTTPLYGNTISIVNTRGATLKYASERLRSDKQLVLEAVKRDCYALEYASEDLKDDKEVVITALSNIKPSTIPEKLYFSGASKKIIKYISERLQNDSDILKLIENENIN